MKTAARNGKHGRSFAWRKELFWGFTWMSPERVHRASHNRPSGGKSIEKAAVVLPWKDEMFSLSIRDWSCFKGNTDKGHTLLTDGTEHVSAFQSAYIGPRVPIFTWTEKKSTVNPNCNPVLVCSHKESHHPDITATFTCHRVFVLASVIAVCHNYDRSLSVDFLSDCIHWYRARSFLVPHSCKNSRDRILHGNRDRCSSIFIYFFHAGIFFPNNSQLFARAVSRYLGADMFGLVWVSLAV